MSDGQDVEAEKTLSSHQYNQDSNFPEEEISVTGNRRLKPFYGVIFLFFIVGLTAAIIISVWLSRTHTPTRLQCFQCQSKLNRAMQEDLPYETECGTNPQHFDVCSTDQICGSIYQEFRHSSGQMFKRIIRSCQDRRKLGCTHDTIHGMLEITCTCSEDKCIPLAHTL